MNSHHFNQLYLLSKKKIHCNFFLKKILADIPPPLPGWLYQTSFQFKGEKIVNKCPDTYTSNKLWQPCWIQTGTSTRLKNKNKAHCLKTTSYLHNMAKGICEQVGKFPPIGSTKVNSLNASCSKSRIQEVVEPDQINRPTEAEVSLFHLGLLLKLNKNVVHR